MSPTQIAPPRCPCCHGTDSAFGVYVRSSITHELICRECNSALDKAEAVYLDRL